MTEPKRTISSTAAGFWDNGIGDDVDARPKAPTRRPPPQMIRPEPVQTTAIVPTKPVVEAPAWLADNHPVDVSPAFTVAPGAREQTSAMDRAQALRVRMFPFVLIWGGVGMIVMAGLLLAALEWPLASLAGALVFAAMSAVTYYRLNRTDYDYSREGTERHRLDVAADIAYARMEHEQELRRMALEAYLKFLNGASNE